MALFFAPTEVGVARVTGADATAYLQSQCTADLRTATSQPALWLNRKGRILALTVITSDADRGLLVVSPHLGGPELVALITSNVIADEVEVADESSLWQRGVLWGQGTVVWPRDVHGLVSCRSLSPSWEVLAPLGQALPWTQVALAQLQSESLHSGVPRVPEDAGEKEFPQEVGLDALVSYQKGCYLGQEVMARIHAMGALRRVLRCVTGTGPLVPGMPLKWQGKNVGEVRSAAGKIALAMVPTELAEGQSLEADSGAVTLGPPAGWHPPAQG